MKLRQYKDKSTTKNNLFQHFFLGQEILIAKNEKHQLKKVQKSLNMAAR